MRSVWGRTWPHGSDDGTPHAWSAGISRTPLRDRSARARRPEAVGLSPRSRVNPRRTFAVTSGSPSAGWPWPEDLDAMMAAPEFHTVLFEDDRVRVLDGRVPA